MRTLALLVLLGACQSRSYEETPSAGAKVVESPDDDFLATRAAFQRDSRARLARMNLRLGDMENEASMHLRARREALALRIEQIGEQGESAFDTFRRDVDRSFDEVERELGFH